MKTISIYKDIGVVVVAQMNRDFCNPISLYKHQILSLDELQDVHNRRLVIDSEVVQFTFKELELTCLKDRLQIRSKDVSATTRISDIIRNILMCSPAEVKAIGINAISRYAFFNEPDFMRFCHHISPMDAFSPLSDNALFTGLSFRDWSEAPRPDAPVKLFNIQRVSNMGKQPVVQIGLNSHLEIKGGKDCVEEYLSKANMIHMSFFEDANKLMASIR